MANAEEWTFTYFKPSGKYYASSKGKMTNEAFRAYTVNENKELFRQAVLDLNHGSLPGLIGAQTDLIVHIDGGDNSDFGYPLLLLNGL